MTPAILYRVHPIFSVLNVLNCIEGITCPNFSYACYLVQYVWVSAMPSAYIIFKDVGVSVCTDAHHILLYCRTWIMCIHLFSKLVFVLP